MSEAAPLPPRKDDSRFPQQPTVVRPGEVVLGTPVRIEPSEPTPEGHEESPRERTAKEEARRAVLRAKGRLPQTPEPGPDRQSDGGVPPSGRRKKKK